MRRLGRHLEYYLQAGGIGRRFGPNGAAVKGYDASTDGKTQTAALVRSGAGRWQAEKALKDSFPIFRRNPRPLIDELHAPKAVSDTGPQSDTAALRRGVQRIGEQVEENAAQPARLRQHASVTFVAAHELQATMLRENACVLGKTH